MSTPSQRMEIARRIVDFEARRDSQGRIQVYALPAGDGGGVPAPGFPRGFEVAGVNNRYHPHEAADLAALVKQGLYDQADTRAAAYIASYTDSAAVWTRSLPVEAYLRDCVWNRGARGATRILQLAVGVTPDGVFGPKTAAGLARVLKLRDPLEFLRTLGAAREKAERLFAGRNEKSRFWVGLVNRWRKALAMAREIGGKP